MRTQWKAIVVALVLAVLLPVIARAQTTTSWKGVTSTSWSTASNWTNGVPTSTIEAIIGDANFTGAFQPSITATATCKSLTLGAETNASTLTVGAGLTVSGNVTIGSNGTIVHTTSTAFTLTGNWSNSGTYNATNTSALVKTAGAAQSIGGTSTTTFRSLTINSGSTVTLNANITATKSISISGTLNPNEPTFTVSGGTTLTVNSGGTLHVKASTFAGNYTHTGITTLSANSTVNYSATTTNQTVSNAFTYGTLRVSGAMTKTLAGNLPTLASSSSSYGRIYVDAGTFDMSTFTANRGTTTIGGVLSVGGAATLKIGGTNSLPSNYLTVSIGSTTTVEYYGTNQTVSSRTYGTLKLSSSSGDAVKTMPATAFTINGNLISTVGSGTSVSFTAGSNITVGGSVNIGASTTFNGGSFAHSVSGTWTTDGTYLAGPGTVTMKGTNKTISGSGSITFNNLTVTGSGVSAASGTNITVTGNLTTSGSGTFTHTEGGGGTLTMSGTTKTITGTGIKFNNLTVSGTVTTTASLTVAGNLTSNGSFTATGGTLTMNGASKTIGGTGTLTLYSLSSTGSISTSRSFSMSRDMSTPGTFTATAGTVTFTGTTTLSGAPDLFNVTLNGTTLKLAAGSNPGIAGALTLTAGSFDVWTTVPNTVRFNAAGAQTVAATRYHRLQLSGSGTKTAGGAIRVDEDLVIDAGTTFSAGSYTHTVYEDWENEGSFIAGTSTIELAGTANGYIEGATTFSTLKLNKGTSSVITMEDDITTATLTMTAGKLGTGEHGITITSTRTGNAIVIGTIIRTHVFSNGIDYAFEGPNNVVNFASGASNVTSITMTVEQGVIDDVPDGSPINREYEITATAGGAYSATLRLHYEDIELAGNTEAQIKLWRHTEGSWEVIGKTGNSTADNWVDKSGITALDGHWTMGDDSVGVVRWNGLVSTAWETAGNWSIISGVASRPPATADVVLLGDTTAVNQPTISTTVNVRSVTFKSTQATTLTLSGDGALILGVYGNLGGVWTGNATHTLSVGSESATIDGNLTLSDGTAGHAIDLVIGSGTVTVGGTLTQSGGANVTFTGGGTLKIGGDFVRTSGTFTAGSGTVTYNGAAEQAVAGGITYNNLTFEKTSGTANITAPVTVNGDVAFSTGGALYLNSTLGVGDDVTIGSGTTMIIETNGELSVGGDLASSGTFTPGTGTVVFNGVGDQSIPAGITFGDLTINKASGTATLGGSITVNDDLSITAGTLDLGTYTANRGALGGVLTMGAGSTLLAGGSNNFPANYATMTLAPTSTVNFNGTAAQTIAPATYGNLTLSNGGANAKSLGGPITVAGNLQISSGATFNGDTNTITLAGNWTNSGTFNAGTSHITLTGASKTFSGAGTYYGLDVPGSYTTTNDITISGELLISGTLSTGTTSVTLSGDFLNQGTFINSGVVTFTGLQAQRLMLNTYVSYGSTYFNGTVATIPAGGTQIPRFQDLYVYNTGTREDAAQTGILCFGNLVIGPGVVADAGNGTSVFFGSVTNYGRIISSGNASFLPTGAATINFEASDSAEFSNTGKITLGGTGPITLVGTTPEFNDVDVTNTNAAGVTLVDGWHINGTLSIGAGSTLHGGTGLTHTVKKGWITNGTFDGGTSTVLFGGADTAVVTGTTVPSFHNLTIAEAAMISSGIDISGDLTINAPLETSGAEIAFVGSTPSMIGGTQDPLPLHDFHVHKDNTAATVTTNVNLGPIEHLHIEDGTFDLGTYTMTAAPGNGALVMDVGAIFKVGGSSSFPSFPADTIDHGSTVIYYGTGTQTITAAHYGNLISSSTGARILATEDEIHVHGTFTPGTNNYTVAGSTILFDGEGEQTIPAFNYHNLTNHGDGARVFAPAGTIGIAGTFTPGENTYVVTGSTVNFNGGAQTIPAATFNNLQFSGSGAKTAAGALTLEGDLTIGSGTTFNAGSFTHTLEGDWVNSGTFAADSSTIRFAGADAATLTGATTFNTCRVEKDAQTTTLTVQNDVTAANMNVVAGKVVTGSNTFTITATRTGNGVITGKIRRTHAFSAGTAYAFEGPNNLLTFTNAGTLPSSIIVTVVEASPGATTSMDTIGRYYTIEQTGGSGYNYTLRVHYDDEEISAPNTEGTLKLWRRISTSPAKWDRLGVTASNTTENWVEYAGLDTVGVYSLSSRTIPLMILALAQSESHASPNGDVIYTITYQNDGDASATNTVVTAPVPANTSYVPGTVIVNTVEKTDLSDGDEVSVSGSTITINLSAVAAGAAGTITYIVRVD